MHGSITYIGKFAFNNSRLEKINLASNSIVFRPSKVVDLFSGAVNLRELELSHNNFIYLSSHDIVNMFSPLKNLEKLTIVSGKLFKLPKEFSRVLPSLKYINLDGNNIDTLKSVFTRASNVSKIHLQGNKIRVVDQDSLPDSLLRSVKSLNLALNPFDCTCEMLWFRSALGETGAIGSMQLELWPRQYTCASPTREKGHLFQDFQPTSLGCRNVLLISVITLVSALLLALAVSVISYKYRWYIAYFLYKIKTKRRNKKHLTEGQPLLAYRQLYNVYVIYESEDCNFVRNNLQQILEVKNDFRLHIWDRNSTPGAPKMDQMADGIYASDCVIAVLSKTAIRDDWIRFQLDVAMDRQVALHRDFLALVVRDNIDFKLLSKYWCVMFARLPCARWWEDVDDVRRVVFEQQLVQHCCDARRRAV